MLETGKMFLGTGFVTVIGSDSGDIQTERTVEAGTHLNGIIIEQCWWQMCEPGKAGK